MDTSLLEPALTFSSPPLSTLLDARLLRSLADLSFTHPTLVQAQAIPLILQGKDVLAKARTGSGKTAAYGLPAVQRVLLAKSSPSAQTQPATLILILVPTRELATQVTAFIKSVTTYCEGGEGGVSCLNVAGGGKASLSINEVPDILVATPSKCLALLQSKTISLPHLSLLIIDEADLILSYGHSADVQRLLDPSLGHVPRVGVQGVLMSATMTNDVQALKGLVLRSPAILTLSEPASSSSLTQYSTHTSETDKFLVLYVLLKLKLVKGKSLIFVNTVERGYRVRLFLEQFGIKACVLNAEMPLNSRYHVVEEFNRGAYDYIIATDEADLSTVEDVKEDETAESSKKEETSELIPSGVVVPVEGGSAEEAMVENEENVDKVDETTTTTTAAAESSKSAGKRKADDQPGGPSRSNKKGRREDKAYGVSRGIDFVAVACVINFDLPTTTSAYTHRVGRTARAGQTGLALSLVVPKKGLAKDKQIHLDSAKSDEKTFSKIKAHVKEDMGADIKEWDFGGRKQEIEGFRYRMEDALKAVTAKRVQEARREELRRELLNSEKLKAHFAANPLDFSYLRHDAPLNPARVQPHMKHVPGYLMPKIAKVPINEEVEGHVPFARGQRGGRGGARGGRGGGARGGRGGARGGKKSNPLKNF